MDDYRDDVRLPHSILNVAFFIEFYESDFTHLTFTYVVVEHIPEGEHVITIEYK